MEFVWRLLNNMSPDCCFICFALCYVIITPFMFFSLFVLCLLSCFVYSASYCVCSVFLYCFVCCFSLCIQVSLFYFCTRLLTTATRWKPRNPIAVNNYRIPSPPSRPPIIATESFEISIHFYQATRCHISYHNLQNDKEKFEIRHLH
jgi:hypothetical protein